MNLRIILDGTDRSKRECMAPVLDILPERAEQNKDFEVSDLLPWSEKIKSWFSAV